MSTTQTIIHTLLISEQHIKDPNLIGQILWCGVMTLTVVRMGGVFMMLDGSGEAA